MNEKLLMICDEIGEIFDNNELTYREVLTIIYAFKEAIEKEVETGVKDRIVSIFEDIVSTFEDIVK